MVCSVTTQPHSTQKPPKIDLLLLERKTLFVEGCTENTKASFALQRSRRFSHRDLILLWPTFMCLLRLKMGLRLRCAVQKNQGCSGPEQTRLSLPGATPEDIVSALRRSLGPPKQGIASCTSHTWACVSPCRGCCALSTTELKSAGLLKICRLQSLTESILLSSLQPTLLYWHIT